MTTVPYDLALGAGRRVLTPILSTAAILAICMIAEGCGEHCQYGNGPWRPASVGDACDAPPEIRVNAIDDPCATYHCQDERWTSDEKCNQKLVDGDSRAPLCAGECFADIDPDTATLDVLCADVFAARGPDGGPELTIPRCQSNAEGWTIPSGSTRCVGVAFASGSTFDAVPETCRALGVNGGFIVISNETPPLPEGYTLEVACQFATDPHEPCPGWNATRPPDACAE